MKVFLPPVFILLIIVSCSPYKYPQIEEIPFIPVKYQKTLDDRAQALFSSSGVYRIEVDIADQLFDWDKDDEVSYTFLSKNEDSPASFAFYDNEAGTGAPLVITGIGMRPRGGYSFDHAPKKKYKILFPETNQFYGLKRINLNSNWGDFSMMREKLAYDLFNAAGVPSGRATYARLYMNGLYMGLYLIVEQVGGEFFRARFDSPAGNAYKDNWSELEWVSSNRNDYIQSPTNTSPALEISTNELVFDPADVIRFVDVLNNTPQPQLEAEIQGYLCVHQFLSALSLNALLGLIDDYWYYAHNFFLYNYHGRFMWIPWDLDHSYGAQWAGFVTETSDVYAFGPRNTDYSAGKRPLIDNMLAVPSFCDYYRKCLKYHAEKYFNEEYLYPRVDALAALIHDAALEDPEMVIAGLNEASFYAAIETENQTWVRAIKPYITARNDFVLAEVGNAY